MQHAEREEQDACKLGRMCAVVEKQPLERFPDDVHGGEQEQRGFNECGETFHFSMAVEMIRVGGLICHAHGDK